MDHVRLALPLTRLPPFSRMTLPQLSESSVLITHWVPFYS